MALDMSLTQRPPGRTVRRVGLILGLLLLAHVGLRIRAFVHIFFQHGGTALTQAEVVARYADRVPSQSWGEELGVVDDKGAVVPRIIHQIFHNWTDPGDERVPEEWLAMRQTCIDKNPGWENWLWTESKSRDFLRREYAYFLPTYDGYKYPVQRADALRYFLMRHYGGIYIDLDNGCKTSLEPLRYYPVWVTDGGHGALSNNILGAMPHHPYWRLMTDSLQAWAWRYPLPYLTISYATGQWFETVMWERYHLDLPTSDPGLTRVMMDSRPGSAEWVFFSQEGGGTWVNWDNRMFDWIGDHLAIVALLALGGIGAVGFGAFHLVKSRPSGYEVAMKEEGY